jgi:hypothetical protein
MLHDMIQNLWVIELLKLPSKEARPTTASPERGPTGITHIRMTTPGLQILRVKKEYNWA